MRKYLKSSLITTIIFLLLAMSASAQEDLWKELSEKAVSLYQQEKFSL